MDELETLTDDEAVAFVVQLSKELAAVADDQHLDDALDNFRGEATSEVADFVLAGFGKSGGDSLPAGESVVAARAILDAVGQHPVLGPVARERAKSFTNPEAGDPIMSIGIAASLIFMAVSSYVHVSYDRESGWSVSFGKDPVRKEGNIRAVLNALNPFARKIASSANDE